MYTFLLINRHELLQKRDTKGVILKMTERAREKKKFPAHVSIHWIQTYSCLPTHTVCPSCLTSCWSMSVLSLPEGWSLGVPGTGGRAWFMHHCFLWMDPKLEWTQALCVWHNGLWQQLETYSLSGIGQTLKKRQLEGDWGKRDNSTGEWWYMLYKI